MHRVIVVFRSDRGEKSLRSSAVLVNHSQRDDSRRCPGSKIDAILLLREMNLYIQLYIQIINVEENENKHWLTYTFRKSIFNTITFIEYTEKALLFILD